MRLAAKLLGETELSVAEIGKKIGYASVAAFSRAFKRFAGRSALSYRREISSLPE
jgi:AraC-like DNA-binding protein